MAKNLNLKPTENAGPKDFVVLSPIRIGNEAIAPGTDDERVIIALDDDMAKALIACGAVVPVKAAPEVATE